MATSSTPQRQRLRQRRHDAEQQILDAAERLLRERRFRDLTVDDIMAATSQSRTAFYRFFTDRHALLIRLIYDLAEELWAMSESWMTGTGDPVHEGRQALERLVGVYTAHGPLLAAIAEAAGSDDEVEKVYGGLVQRFVDGTAARIERDQAAGRALPLDPREGAAALVWMTERYLAATFDEPGTGDRSKAVDTLLAIWMRAIYGSDQPAG